MKRMQTSILILMVLMLSSIVSADLDASAVSISGAQASSPTGTLTVNNDADQTVNVTVSIGSISGPATFPASSVTLDAETAKIDAESSADFEITADIADDQAVGTYTATITISGDDGNSTTANLSISVSSNNNAPYFTSTAITNGVVGVLYEYQATASDVDNDSLTFDLNNGPTNMQVSNGGLVTWTPTATGDYDVSISVTDGEDTTLQNYSITVIQAQGTLIIGDIVMGDEDQERGVTISKTFTLKNNGANSVENLTYSLSGVSSTYDLNISIAGSSIPANSEIQVTASTYIPEDENSGLKDIGDIIFTGTSNGQAVTSGVKDINLEVVNHLEIDRVEMIVNNDESERISEDETIDEDDIEFRPGDEISFEITLENTFDDGEDKYDLDIEDIEVEIEADEGDFDWNENDDMGDLNPGDDDTVTLNVEIPDDAEEEDVDVTITVSSFDENGAEHTQIFVFTLEFKREDEDIRFSNTNIIPGVLECGETGRMEVEIENIGQDDQDDTVILATSSPLGIEEIIREISIDSDDNLERTVSFDVPDNARAGEYFLTLEVFTSDNDDDRTDIESVSFRVTCGNDDNDNSNSNNNNNNDDDNGGTVIDVVTPTTPTSPTSPTGGQVVSTTTGTPSGFLSSNDGLYIGLLIGVGILLILLIVLIAAAAFRK